MKWTLEDNGGGSDDEETDGSRRGFYISFFPRILQLLLSLCNGLACLRRGGLVSGRSDKVTKQG